MCKYCKCAQIALQETVRGLEFIWAHGSKARPARDLVFAALLASQETKKPVLKVGLSPWHASADYVKDTACSVQCCALTLADSHGLHEMQKLCRQASGSYYVLKRERRLESFEEEVASVLEAIGIEMNTLVPLNRIQVCAACQMTF